MELLKRFEPGSNAEEVDPDDKGDEDGALVHTLRWVDLDSVSLGDL